MYKEKMKALLKLGVIGIPVGLIFGIWTCISNWDGVGFFEGIAMILFSILVVPLIGYLLIGGFICTWRLTGQLLQRWSFSRLLFLIVQFFRLMICWYLGWAVYMVNLLYTFVRMKSSGKSA